MPDASHVTRRFLPRLLPDMPREVIDALVPRRMERLVS